MYIAYNKTLQKLARWAWVALVALGFAIVLAVWLSFHLEDQSVDKFYSQYRIHIVAADVLLFVYGLISLYLMLRSTVVLLGTEGVDMNLRRRALVGVWVIPFVSVTFFLCFGLKILIDGDKET
ncbi:hypothetical protein J7I44_05270 [Frateuria sp. MAH-13]|uniref:Uncharacterized protein n=1 Tax=Frateuria flava TaxID=2821489 RepID=A0ABS4DKY0_9GAMM|nr:hypothetical protein [Frateuria flava]MBP1473699.1 hypothetical protein [Frateuria flava]